jgi:hypothetical protein
MRIEGNGPQRTLREGRKDALGNDEFRMTNDEQSRAVFYLPTDDYPRFLRALRPFVLHFYL